MRRQVQLIGIPSDSNSSFLRGAARAPAQIRAALASTHGNSAAENGLEIGSELHIQDMGDLAITETPQDDAVISAAILAAVKAGALPISIGGDHWVTCPIVQSLAKLHGPLSILHIDAHPDLYDHLDHNRRSHASPFARILESGSARRLVQIGVRTVNRHQREQAQRFQVVEQIPARRFSPALVPVLQGPLYISIDLDGIDPSEAPGVAHHEPGGLTVREVLDALDRQTAWVAGADVVELNPDRDVDGVTAVLAAKLVRELAAMTGAA
ncbi:MAG: agmatinase family protein [Proteobacteria bacterium]|nr:agmatinase family protein [Pseudomonadota bacterium]